MRVDGCMDKNMTVGKLIVLVQNPNRIKPQTVKSMLYPLDKKKIDYRIYRFYRNLVTAFYEVKVANEENLPDKGGYIICANHVSNFDFIFLTHIDKQTYHAVIVLIHIKMDFFHIIISVKRIANNHF